MSLDIPFEQVQQSAQLVEGCGNKGEELGLKNHEYAFYEALAENACAQAVMQENRLLTIAIAREVTTAFRNGASIDWRQRE